MKLIRKTVTVQLMGPFTHENGHITGCVVTRADGYTTRMCGTEIRSVGVVQDYPKIAFTVDLGDRLCLDNDTYQIEAFEAIEHSFSNTLEVEAQIIRVTDRYAYTRLR